MPTPIGARLLELAPREWSMLLVSKYIPHAIVRLTGNCVDEVYKSDLMDIGMGGFVEEVIPRNSARLIRGQSRSSAALQAQLWSHGVAFQHC